MIRRAEPPERSAIRCTMVGVVGECEGRDEQDEEADDGGRWMTLRFTEPGPAERERLLGFANFVRDMGKREGEDCRREGLWSGVGVKIFVFLSGVAGRTFIAPVRLTFRAPLWGVGLIARTECSSETSSPRSCLVTSFSSSEVLCLRRRRALRVEGDSGAFTLLDSTKTDLGLYLGKDEFASAARGRKLDARVNTRLGLFPAADEV